MWKKKKRKEQFAFNAEKVFWQQLSHSALSLAIFKQAESGLRLMRWKSGSLFMVEMRWSMRKRKIRFLLSSRHL